MGGDNSPSDKLRSAMFSVILEHDQVFSVPHLRRDPDCKSWANLHQATKTKQNAESPTSKRYVTGSEVLNDRHIKVGPDPRTAPSGGH